MTLHVTVPASLFISANARLHWDEKNRRDRGWHFDETDECLDETACDCDRYEPKEGQGR